MWSSNARERAVLAWLLAPHSIEEFAEKYYERAPLYIPRNEPHRYDRYFTLEEYERVLYGSIVRAKDLGMVKNGVGARIETYAQESSGDKRTKAPVYDLIDSDRVSALFGGGCSLVLDRVGTMSPPLARLIRELEVVFGHRVNANVYLTPPGNQGFAIHYDTHDTIIIQIEGSKHWRVYNSATELPLEDEFFDKSLHAVGDVQLEMEMQPGDLLYLPRGVLHEGKANDVLSLHVTLGLYPQKWYNALMETVAKAARAHPRLRSTVNLDDLSSSEFAQILDSIFAEDAVRDAVETSKRQFCRERRNGLDGQMRQIAELPRLSDASVVAMRPNMLYDMTATEQSTKLAFNGKTLTFGKGAAAIVHALEATERVEMASLIQLEEHALKIVKRLIQEGFAVQLPAAGGAKAQTVA